MRTETSWAGSSGSLHAPMAGDRLCGLVLTDTSPSKPVSSEADIAVADRRRGLFFVGLAVAGVGVAMAVQMGVNANFLWFTAFVGANLFQSGFTNLCPLVAILKKFGFKEDCESC